jgi:hypothetical protein
MLHFINLDKKELIYGHSMNLLQNKESIKIFILGGFGNKTKEEFGLIIYVSLKKLTNSTGCSPGRLR